MKLEVDAKADALYLRLDDSQIMESEEVSPGVVLDYNKKNQVVGIELLISFQAQPQTQFTRATVSSGVAG